jgi:CelD/BcsL family acetyltransferase involved in cellulose biosynthesis
LIGANELDAGLLQAWRSVQASQEAFRSPYFCPEFTIAVAAVRPDVRVVVIECDGRPVGFFPHQRSRWGRGRPVGGPLSDFHGVIAARDAEWTLPALMGAARLSVWPFDHLVGDSAEFAAYRRASGSSPQIDLSGGYASYVRGRRDAGSDYIPKTEGLARKLGREVGELQFSFHEPDEAVLQQLMAWKSDQYLRANTTNVFGVPWTRRLLHQLSGTACDEFAGVCSVLRAGDQVVSIHMGMRSSTSLHYWFPAYDPELAKFSVGIILLLRMAEAAVDLGMNTIDLGKGDSLYKQRLATGSVALSEGLVSVPSLWRTVLRLRDRADACQDGGRFGKALSVPLKIARRVERADRFR